MALEGMTFDQLLALANANRDKDGGIRSFLQGDMGLQNQGLEGLTMGSADGVNPDFFLHDPTNTSKRGGGFILGRGADGSITRKPYNYDSEWGAAIPLGMMLGGFGAALGGVGAGVGAAGMGEASGASGVLGSSAAGGGELAAAAGGAYSIPTAAELAAAGYDVGGMGLTGAGGIGAAESLAGAGAGAAGGYGAAAGGGMLDAAGNFLTSRAGSAITGGLLSGLAGATAPKSATSTSSVQLDPRMAALLYGADGNSGLLGQIAAQANSPQNAGMKAFGTGMDNYLGDYGRAEFDNNMRGAVKLRDMQFNAPSAGAAQVQAPSQNNLNLSPAYQDMIYGQPGNNPYLTGAIQKGINQSNYAFGNYLTDATKATQDLLGNIRGGAVLNNTMGSSRQGIAEGRAIGDLTQNLGRAATQFGINNTDAAVSAQAGAYDTDRSRSLAAMSGLGAQQYGVASQNASMQQQANLANMQSQLQTNAQNAQNLQNGTTLSSGLLGQAAGYGQNQDQYQSQKLGQTAGLLAPFTGLGSTQTQTQPLYSNTLGNIAGGAMAGLGIYNMFNK